jgi:hypothetical protein
VVFANRSSKCPVQRPWRGVGLLFFIAASLTASGCLTHPPPSPPMTQTFQDGDVLLGDSIPPYWYGLLAGESTEKEVLEKAAKLPFLDPGSMRHTMVGYAPNSTADASVATSYAFSCRSTPRDWCVRFILVQGVLVRLETQQSVPMSLERLVAFVGEPNYVGASLLGVEQPYCRIDVIWLSVNFYASQALTGKEGVTACLRIRSDGRPPVGLGISSTTYESSGWVATFPRTDVDVPWRGFEGTDQ